MPVPFVPAPFSAKTQMFFRLDGQEVVWVLNFTRGAVWTDAQRVSHNTLMHGWWTTQLKGLFSTAIALERIVTTNLDTASAPQTTEVVSPAEAGTNAASGSLPGGTALVMTHRTALRGRNYRGRTYTAGINTSNTATPNTAALILVNNLVSAFFALKGLCDAATTTWVVLSKFFAKFPRAAAVVTPITAISADQLLDSQRRRLTGRGV